jgi:Tfp pilus assembly ATPase PilU
LNIESEPPLILKYLIEMDKRQASDLYITVGSPASLRIDDELLAISDVLTPEDIDMILGSVLTVRQRRMFESEMEMN